MLLATGDGLMITPMLAQTIIFAFLSAALYLVAGGYFFPRNKPFDVKVFRAVAYAGLVAVIAAIVYQ